MKNWFLLLILCLAATAAFSQEKPAAYKDVVYMENGSIFKARILSYEQGGEVTLEIEGGHTLVVQESEIRKIVQLSEVLEEAPKEKEREPRLSGKDFPDKGFYFGGGLMIAPGLSAVDEFAFMLGVDGLAGYQWNHWLGTGVGFGYDSYDQGRAERIYPAFAEVRLFPFKNNLKPYLRLAGGYGFAFKNLQRDLVEAEGGWMFHPAIGTRFYSGKDSDLFGYVDLGVRIQQASFTWENPDFTFADRARRDITYQRWTVRFGFQFWTNKTYRKKL